MSTKIIFNKDGKPFKEKMDAFKHLTDNKLVEYCVQKHGGGWALILTESFEVDTKPVKKAKMTYSKVIFSPRTDPNQPEQVQLSVNDLMLVCNRGVEVIIPDSHVEAADHATQKSMFFDDRLQEVVNQGELLKYPYSHLGKVSESEYRAALKQGNAQRDNDLIPA